MMLLNYTQIRWINSYATLVVTWSMAWNRSRIKTFPTNTTNPSLSGHVTTVVIICSLTPVSFRLVSFKLYFLVLLFLLAWAVTGWDCRIECFVAHWVFCGQVMCIRTHKHTQTFRHSMDIKGVRSDALSHRPFFFVLSRNFHQKMSRTEDSQVFIQELFISIARYMFYTVVSMRLVLLINWGWKKNENENEKPSKEVNHFHSITVVVGKSIKITFFFDRKSQTMTGNTV